MESVAPFVGLLVAFFLGSLPTGLWAGRFARGIDIRDHGSGNLGATNVYRTLGPRWGIGVMLLDAGKGALAVAAARALDPSHPTAAGVLGMAGAFLGHMFTPLAGFRGGKGVATAAGSWAALLPLPFLAALLGWALVFAITRIVSLASIVAVVVLPVAVLVVGAGSPRAPWLWLALATMVFVLVRHRSNLRRLRRGEERRLALRGSTAESKGPAR